MSVLLINLQVKIFNIFMKNHIINKQLINGYKDNNFMNMCQYLSI